MAVCAAGNVSATTGAVDALSSFSSSSVLQGRFMIPADEVEQLLQRSGLSTEEFLFSLIKPASKQARPPISGYHVGAVALGASGAIYVGVNIEFPFAPLNNSIHAEQCLLVNCLHHGEQHIRALAVSAAPCGHCRQFYSELNNADSLQFMFGKDSKPKYLADLLPERFGPADLQDEPFPLLLDSQHHPLALTQEAEALLQARTGAPGTLQQQQQHQEGDGQQHQQHQHQPQHQEPSGELFAQAAAEALQEATKCYAPYTRCYSGAAIITTSGRVYAGGCVESAAYNPTLGPFHAAVVDAITNRLQSFTEIAEVVLVQKRDAKVSHAANIELLLRSVAPGAVLTVLEAVDA